MKLFAKKAFLLTFRFYGTHEH